MRIRIAEPADFSAMADICRDAFMNDRLFNWMYPYRKQYPEDFRSNFLQSLKRRYYSRPGYVLVAESDEFDIGWSGNPVIMGYASWMLADKNQGTKRSQMSMPTRHMDWNAP